jgi:hypothetical protein
MHIGSIHLSFPEAHFSQSPLKTMNINFEYINIILIIWCVLQLKTLLVESYGGTYTDCGDTCLTFYPTPLSTGLFGDIDQRKIWFWGNYPGEYYS